MRVEKLDNLSHLKDIYRKSTIEKGHLSPRDDKRDIVELSKHAVWVQEIKNSEESRDEKLSGVQKRLADGKLYNKEALKRCVTRLLATLIVS